MSYAEIGLSDQRILEISRQTKDWRAGQKIIPLFLTRILPKEWGRAVQMKLNPPSSFELAAEIASLLHLEVSERYFFEFGFGWRVNNLQWLDFRKRNSSIISFLSGFGVRDDPNFLQELKQAEGNVKNIIGIVTGRVETVFPDQDSSLVWNWLEASRKAGANLGTAFYYSPTDELTMLKQQISRETGDINDSREKVPSDVRAYLNNSLKIVKEFPGN